MNKEVIFICESVYHNNTMRLAKAMAYGLNCEVVNTQDALSIDLSQYKIVGLGSGIYFTSHHPKIFVMLDKLNPLQRTLIFSTHGGPFLGYYHKRLKEELDRRKIGIIGEFSAKGFDCTGPFTIIGGGNKGKPDERDEQRAIKFISKILPQYKKDLSNVPEGHFVHVSDECIGCGKCIAACPMNVFAVKENISVAVNEHECIHCSLCQIKCPQQAISIKHSFAEAIKIAVRHAKKRSL